MKARQANKTEDGAVEKRKKVVEHLLTIANHTLKTSNDSDAQAEAVACKRLLEDRMREIEQQPALAA